MRRLLPAAAVAATLLLAVPAAADNVVADDNIVQGSECVGLDCVNGESFGFDTLRLKENNDRISFVDTSTGAGFASDDWTLSANDSNSGGDNHFFLTDLTTNTTPLNVYGAPNNSLLVRPAGDVVAGTTLREAADPAAASAGTPADGSAILAALRTLALTSRTYNADTASVAHLWPTSADFFTAFGLGQNDGTIAPGDMAAVALAAVKALDARVSALPAPGQGPAGAAGANGANGANGATGADGAAGPAGAQGPAGASPSTTTLAKRVKTLEGRNAKLTRRLTELEHTVAGLAKQVKPKKGAKHQR